MEPTQPNQQPKPAGAEIQPGAAEISPQAEPTVASQPAAPAPAAGAPVSPILPITPQTPAQVNPPTTTPTTTPATADDADVIEKQWVDAAEAMEEKTAGDPHAEEEGFEDLQVDYIRKRFGKDIKKPKES